MHHKNREGYGAVCTEISGILGYVDLSKHFDLGRDSRRLRTNLTQRKEKEIRTRRKRTAFFFRTTRSRPSACIIKSGMGHGEV